jgi:N-acyl-phosphatidylethanolamine-hydrolysing phospholipase D
MVLPVQSAEDQSPDEIHSDMTLREIAENKLHHGKERFINPFNSKHYGNFWEVLKWKLFAKNEFTQFYPDEKVLPVRIDWSRIINHQGLSITFVTHSTIMIKDIDSYILVDPVLFGLFWPIKDFTPLDFDLEDMPKPEYILLTHGHYDHLDKQSLEYFIDSSRYISPLGYGDILEDVGARNITELDWFDVHRDGTREIILLPCNHWTMRNPITGPNTALWGSYLIKTAAGPTIFISGDTAYFDRFSEIGREFNIDLAIFNLGAYEPRWFMKKSHINPEDTVKAFVELGAKKLMVVHWGTFRLGDEPVHFPPAAIKEEMKKAGLTDKLVDLKHGETLFLNEASGTGR